jgi:hypothetical protein
MSEIPNTNYIMVTSKDLIMVIVPIMVPIPTNIEQIRMNLSYERNI